MDEKLLFLHPRIALFLGVTGEVFPWWLSDWQLNKATSKNEIFVLIF